MNLQDRHDAYRLLHALGASQRLLTHLKLVGEAAELLITALRELGLSFDAQLVELGAAVHDAGKMLHPAELDQAGALHEPAGESLLLAHGAEPRVARCCVSHAQWRDPTVSLEERIVALADKLWKGKREVELEALVISAVTQGLALDHWSVFLALDNAFEKIAADGPDRLARSVGAGLP